MKKLLFPLTFIFVISFLTTFFINLNSMEAKSEAKSMDNNEVVEENIVESEAIASTLQQDTSCSSDTSFSNDTTKALKAEEPSVSTSVLLVNKLNKLDSDYVPKSLKTSNVKAISSANSNARLMDSEAALALEKLFKAASEDNITLLAVSGYRTYDYQKNLYTKQVAQSGKSYADKYVARPGFSEHQTGLAMDLLSTEYTSLDDGFENTKAYKWLKDNCGNYGFIIRYPKEKEAVTNYSFEPWHIRYVGIQASKEIMEKGLTLEEYLELGMSK
jgi:D-alanyl-D-alanine carboxypeptidase